MSIDVVKLFLDILENEVQNVAAINLNAGVLAIMELEVLSTQRRGGNP